MNVFGFAEDAEKRATQAEAILRFILPREAEILRKTAGRVIVRHIILSSSGNVLYVSSAAT